MIARRAAAIAACACSGLVLAACAEQRRGNGDECLKDDDCLSGVCVARVCGTPPPTYSGLPPIVDGGAPANADAHGPDVADDAGDGAAAAGDAG